MIDTLFDRLSAYIPPERLRRGEMMARHTTFRIGGPADIALMAAGADEIIRARRDAAELGVDVFIMGNGSNLLVRDGGIRGLVIIIGEAMSAVRVEGQTLTAGAGAALTRVCREAQAAGLGGLVFASGIPGSVGGAVAMNAGAYGGQISDVLTRARVIDGERVVWYDANELALGYRDSRVLRGGLIVTEAEFGLKPADPGALLDEMNELARRRREKQPLTLPSAGSVFKRPEGHFAGALIEGAGLKGVSVGGAQVSQLHAGFIVNTGGATARDVLDLIALIRRRVLERDGVTLETEVRVVGED